MYLTMRQECYWPSVFINMHNAVRRCASLAKDRIYLRKHTNLLKSFPAQTLLESVALDRLGSLPKLKSGYIFILVMVDRFTMLCRFKEIRSTTAPKNC